MPGSPDRPDRRPPRVLLVTDSARLLPGAPAADRAVAVELQARRAFAARVDAVLLREPGFDGATLYALARAIAAEGRLIVADRADVAIASGAAGVHLRADGPAPERVRRLIGPAMSLSRAVHSIDEASRHGVVGEVDRLDWLVAGTVFDSISKPGTAPLGLDGLAALVGASRVPIVAIGGITGERAAAVREAGAAGIAAIGAFLGDFRPEHVDRLRDRSLE